MLTLDEFMKCFFNISAIASGCFYVVKIVHSSILPNVSFLNLSSIFSEVEFVANKEDANSLRTIRFELLYPIIKVIKCVELGDIINYESTYCASVVLCNHWSIPLLSCRIPNLRFYRLIIVINRLCCKFNPDCCFAFITELVLCKSAQ